MARMPNCWPQPEAACNQDVGPWSKPTPQRSMLTAIKRLFAGIIAGCLKGHTVYTHGALLTCLTLVPQNQKARTRNAAKMRRCSRNAAPTSLPKRKQQTVTPWKTEAARPLGVTDSPKAAFHGPDQPLQGGPCYCCIGCRPIAVILAIQEEL